MRNIIAGSLNIFTGISLWSSHEKMQIQTDSFTAIGSKKMFLHSDEKLLANSKGTLDIKSDGCVNTSSKADEAKKEKTGEISIAMVEFRPTSTYDGSFGFDWLRVDDNKLEKQSHYSEEQPYNSIIEGGYGDGKTDLTGGKNGSAYKKLKSEYKMIVVNMQDKSDGSKRTKEYFVPYLSIYPKSYVDTLANTGQKNKPVFETELALLVDIGVDEIDSLEFKYDENIFELDKNKLQDTKRTAAGKQFSMDKTSPLPDKSFRHGSFPAASWLPSRQYMAGSGPSTRLVSAVNTISAGHQHICGEGLFFPVVIIYGMPMADLHGRGPSGSTDVCRGSVITDI